MYEDRDHAIKVKPFWLYKLPQRAMREVLKHQLVIVGYLNAGHVEAALQEAGFTVEPTGGDPRSFHYSTDLSWPTGETFHIESPAPWLEMTIGLHEFRGIECVLDTALALLDIPKRISLDEFLKAGRPPTKR
ncbi:MAG: hypothetical protein J0J03_03320 [Leifsonia sp.]|nr:hypothetical protein [Leifsonia sp.]